MGPERFDPKRDYPLASERPDLVRTPSGKRVQDITLADVVSGGVDAQEIRIGPEALELQAQIAEAHGRTQMATNFRRAAELTQLPDKEILRIYEALRPCRCTRTELSDIVQELETRYQSPINAEFIREAMEIYEVRGLLRKA
jgi:propanediol dehydratase small subunit